jgi:hypothetical protein
MALDATFIQYFYQSWNNSERDRRAYNNAIAVASERTGIEVDTINGVATVPGLPTFDQLVNEGPVATNPPDPLIPADTLLSSRQVVSVVASDDTVVRFSFSVVEDPETGTYGVWDNANGRFVRVGLTENQAILLAREFSINGVPVAPTLPGASAIGSGGLQPPPVLPNLSVIQVGSGTWTVFDQDTGRPVVTGLATRELAEAELERVLREATGVDDGGVTVTPVDDPRNVLAGQDADADAQAALLAEARAQQAINDRRRLANQGDWRVRLQLAPLADYLYKAADPGILLPLTVSDGVIFPYTPKIDLSYRAMYDVTSPTHANYNNYFYKGSLLDPVNITATFTAQDTAEANYLLAVIHFFRSITKMFYGQDPQRGAPPPLVYFTGLGEYQFSQHPCVVHQFNYSLPSDVDYIRARSVMDPGTNLQTRRSRESVATNPFSFALKRLRSLGQGINVGAVPAPPAPPTLGQNSPTYVPTRIDISLILYPIQSRSQVSKQFSVKQYANGDLLKGGFW